MKVHVHKRNGNFLYTVDISEDATVEQFKAVFYKERA